MAGGTTGVLLLGSQARGDAGDGSDVNLVALGDGPQYSLRQTEALLLSVSWRTAHAVRWAFAHPQHAGGAVGGWRTAVALHDADGTLGALVGEAQQWSWTDIESERRAWIAAQLTHRAEQVHRLARAIPLGRWRTAAINRSLLATRLPIVAAVHHRLVYDSEHALFDQLTELMGPEWSKNYDESLGLDLAGNTTDNLADSCRAALRIYALLAPDMHEYLSDDQRSVVQSATQLIWSGLR